MRLSKRIYRLAESVPHGNTAADIGTDHGYVPMLLIKNDISPRVIMSDISEGSLSKAKETFGLCGLTVDPADFRIGDGLATVKYGEVDTIIIAGLGGHTIVDILDANVSKSRSFDTLILQPRKHSGSLRYYIYTHGWDIEREHLAEEGKFACEIIVAKPAGIYKRPAPYSEDDIRWKYPASIVDVDKELAGKRIEWKLSSIDEQIGNLSKQKSDEYSELIASLQKDKEYLRGLINEEQ